MNRTIPVPCSLLENARRRALAVVMAHIDSTGSQTEITRVVGCTDGGEDVLEYTSGLWVRDVVQSLGGCSAEDAATQAGAVLKELATPYVPELAAR